MPYFGLDLCRIESPYNRVYVSLYPQSRAPNYSHPLSCQEEIPNSIKSLSDSGCQRGQVRRQVWPAQSPCHVLVPMLTGTIVKRQASQPPCCPQWGPLSCFIAQTGWSQKRLSSPDNRADRMLGPLFSVIFGEFVHRDCMGLLEYQFGNGHSTEQGGIWFWGKNSSVWTCFQKF
jgi:hypothetical protein